MKKKKHTHRTGFFESGYLWDAVYGASDGIITTFAIVAGVSGAALSNSVVLILGFANLIADGFSMAAGDYLGAKSHESLYDSRRRLEEKSVQKRPKEEMKRLEEVYTEKGFSGKDLIKVCAAITSKKKVWVDTIMSECLGINRIGTHPTKGALVTFFSFILAGLIPLLVYVGALFIPYLEAHTFVIAIISTALTLFLVGAFKSKVTYKNWFMEGLQMLSIGGIAAIAAYFIGYFVSMIV